MMQNLKSRNRFIKYQHLKIENPLVDEIFG